MRFELEEKGGRECAYLTARAAMPATKAKVLLNSMLVVGVSCLCGCVAYGGMVGVRQAKNFGDDHALPPRAMGQRPSRRLRSQIHRVCDAEYVESESETET